MVDNLSSTPRTPVHGKVLMAVKRPSKAQQELSNPAASLSKLSKLERKKNDNSTVASSSLTSRTTGTGTSFASAVTSPTSNKSLSNKSLLGEDYNIDWDWFDDTPSKSNSKRKIVAKENLSIDLLKKINKQLNQLQKKIELEQILPLLNEQCANNGESTGNKTSTRGKRDSRDLPTTSRHSTGKHHSRKIRGKRDSRDLTAGSRHSISGGSVGALSRKSRRDKLEPRDLGRLSHHSTGSKRRESEKRTKRRSSHGGSHRSSAAHHQQEKQTRSSSISSKKSTRRSSESHRRPSGSRKQSSTDTNPSTLASPAASSEQLMMMGGEDPNSPSYSWWNLDKASMHKSKSGILRDSLHGDSQHGEEPSKQPTSKCRRSGKSSKRQEEAHPLRDRKERRKKKRSSAASASSSAAAAASAMASPGNSIWSQSQHSKSPRARRTELGSSRHRVKRDDDDDDNKETEDSTKKSKRHSRSKSKAPSRSKSKSRDKSKSPSPSKSKSKRSRSKSKSSRRKNRSIDEKPKKTSARDLLLDEHLSSLIERTSQQPQSPLQRLSQAMLLVDDNEAVAMDEGSPIAAEFDFSTIDLDFEFEAFENIPPSPLKIEWKGHS